MLLSLAISVITSVIAYVILESRDLPTPPWSEIVGQWGRNALVAALLGAFGVGFGAIVRNQPTAIVAILVYGFVIDGILGFTVPEAARFSPTGALERDPGNRGRGRRRSDVAYYSTGVATLLLLAWVGAMFAAGAAMLKARDVD